MSDKEITDEQRKLKAEAAAKAREERRKEREARLKAEEELSASAPEPEDEQRRLKAEAAAKAREERRKAREAREETTQSGEELTEESKQLKREAAAKAREERRKAREANITDTAEESADLVEKPSPNQPLLDQVVRIIGEVGDGGIEESYINELDRHLPCIVVSANSWMECAGKLKENSELPFQYLRNVSGVDYETHMEVVYHILSLHTGQDICVKVRTHREAPSIPSVTPIWATANWPEREIYDLLGIEFPGHPNLRRIMMPDDWVGHPLRKDYEAYDPEV